MGRHASGSCVLYLWAGGAGWAASAGCLLTPPAHPAASDAGKGTRGQPDGMGILVLIHCCHPGQRGGGQVRRSRSKSPLPFSWPLQFPVVLSVSWQWQRASKFARMRNSTCLWLIWRPRPPPPPPPPPGSWERYTLDGSPSLLPPPDSPQDPQARHFLDFYSTEDLQQDGGTVSRTRRRNLLPGVVSFNMVAKGFFYGGCWPLHRRRSCRHHRRRSWESAQCVLPAVFCDCGVASALFICWWCPPGLLVQASWPLPPSGGTPAPTRGPSLPPRQPKRWRHGTLRRNGA